MNELKARLLDDDAFRVKAIPFTGPIPSPMHPGGVDLDGEAFTHDTDIKPDWWRTRAVDWHHGKDAKMGRTVIGKAVDLKEEDDGWWVTVWLDHGERRTRLIQRLQDAGARLYGSSEPVQGLVKTDGKGTVTQWPYWRQTLSTSPQNTHSVLEPAKATLADVMSGDYPPTQAFWNDIQRRLDDLTSDLRGGAKAGRDLDELADTADRLTHLLSRRA